MASPSPLQPIIIDLRKVLNQKEFSRAARGRQRRLQGWMENLPTSWLLRHERHGHAESAPWTGRVVVRTVGGLEDSGTIEDTRFLHRVDPYEEPISILPMPEPQSRADPTPAARAHNLFYFLEETRPPERKGWIFKVSENARSGAYGIFPLLLQFFGTLPDLGSEPVRIRVPTGPCRQAESDRGKQGECDFCRTLSQASPVQQGAERGYVDQEVESRHSGSDSVVLVRRSPTGRNPAFRVPQVPTLDFAFEVLLPGFPPILGIGDLLKEGPRSELFILAGLRYSMIHHPVGSNGPPHTRPARISQLAKRALPRVLNPTPVEKMEGRLGNLSDFSVGKIFRRTWVALPRHRDDSFHSDSQTDQNTEPGNNSRAPYPRTTLRKWRLPICRRPSWSVGWWNSSITSPSKHTPRPGGGPTRRGPGGGQAFFQAFFQCLRCAANPRAVVSFRRPGALGNRALIRSQESAVISAGGPPRLLYGASVGSLPNRRF